MNELLSAAQRYLALGLSVIALEGKMPNRMRHPHGIKDAYDPYTTDGTDAHCVQSFEHPKTTGIGIATGWPAIVVDIDGEEGAQAWKALVGEDIPDRWVATTGRGLHIYYGVVSTEPIGGFKLGEKLDLKGAGGYVAAPPSIHPSGRRYEWLIPPDDILIEMPDALAARIEQHKRDQRAWADRRSIARPVIREPFDGKTFYAVSDYAGIIERMRNADDGERNSVLNWAAFRLAEDGWGDEVFDELYEAARSVKLPAREARRTIRSARESRVE